MKIQELTVEGCRNCHAAKNTLEEIKTQFPNLEIEYVDMMSEAGQALVSRFSIMSAPGIIINDVLFCTGGLDKAKLIEYLKTLS